MTKIKICGIRREEDINIVNKYMPDYIGFVFANSKRKITRDEAIKLKNMLNKDIKAVGVFRNDDLKYVMDIALSGAIDIIQLHGDESLEYINFLKKYIKLPIIKAYNNYENADYALFDNDNPGNGMTFDWDNIDKNTLFFLAGGINKDNVRDALKLNPYCIDVSSSVESDGYKDEAKVEEIIRLVKNYEG